LFTDCLRGLKSIIKNLKNVLIACFLFAVLPIGAYLIAQESDDFFNN
jgi:hypothetical protein